MKILLAVDLSESQSMIRTVEKLVSQLEAELFVLHVGLSEASAPMGTFVDPMTGVMGFAPYTIYHPDLEDSLHELQEHAFHRFLTKHFTQPVHAALREGDPADIILQDAESHDVELIILGKRHHSAIERLFAGSVATSVINRTKRPTLIVPLEDKDES